MSEDNFWLFLLISVFCVCGVRTITPDNNFSMFLRRTPSVITLTAPRIQHADVPKERSGIPILILIHCIGSVDAVTMNSSVSCLYASAEFCLSRNSSVGGVYSGMMGSGEPSVGVVRCCVPLGDGGAAGTSSDV